ncbi:MAG: glucose-6-phosphate isomerase [Deltaproteobacteria bacterium]|nr:glucose-6-phosphate isomerase [Deltaproteobacteria bacterium]
MPALTIDMTCLTSSGIGEEGLSESELQDVAPRAAVAVQETRKAHAEGKVGFFEAPRARDVASRVLEYARRLPPEIENFVVLGIGGSSLGGRALYTALAKPLDPLHARSKGMPRRLFFPDNVDPCTFHALLKLCPPENTVFNVVTKSGSTVETAAQLLIVLDRLSRALGEQRVRKHLVVTTDPDKGPLRRVVRDMGLESFEVPSNIGGRFSVLTPVGLLPAAAAGLDVHGILDGASAMARRVADETSVFRNPALLLASALYLHDQRRGRNIHVLMPYADGLYDAAEWFRQLWAESLGKARDLKGNTVHVGPTPVAARGATDQHSQVQLFMEGPDDKVILFLTVKERGLEVQIPRGVLGEYDDFAYLGGHGLGELLDAERKGTQLALTREGRPTATITLERQDAIALGELLMLFQAATAFAGSLYGVDPYDQPGVEEGKRLAFGLIGRKGHEAYAEAASQVMKALGDPRFIL